MGKQKHVQKRKSSKESEMDEYDSEIDELYRPFLIHSTTYALLTEQILSLMPSERNVLLTMNEYDLSEINPMHPNTVESPTHVIIFCVRFIAGDTFQPIGGLLVYKHKDQSVILAECLKAYINDLWKLGLHVVGTVSPPFESFKGMLSHLVNVKDFNTYAGCLIYSVAPVKEIIHIYDIQFLLIKLQNLFKEGDIKFAENFREYRATWNDISLVLNLSSEFKILSNYLLDNKDVSRRVHIFTQQIFEQLLELEAQGVLSKNAGGSAVLLNCVRSFLQFTELDLVDLNLMCEVDSWNSFINILHTMTFQKSKKRTCTKSKPIAIHTITNPSVRRKIEFHLEQAPEIMTPLTESMDDILIDKSDEYFENDCEILEINKSAINNKNDCPESEGNSKQKKSKAQDSTHAPVNEVHGYDKVGESDTSKTEVNFKKLSDTQATSNVIPKKPETSMKILKTDFEHKTNHNIKENSDLEDKSVENKLPSETENHSRNVCRKKLNQQESGNKINLNCDIDNNNNNDENLQNGELFKKESTTLKVKNDKTKLKKNSTNNRPILNEENFDIVINDAQKFLESFIGFGISTNEFDLTNEEVLSYNVHTATEDLSDNDFIDVENDSSDYLDSTSGKNEKVVDSYNDFCSQTDEETENCVTKICDKVPTIVESLSNEEVKDLSDDFEQNDVTFEILCTVFGMKKLMENLINRRVKIAKPDSFVVEHIDFFVTVIKRDKNRLNPVYYYGHNYGFLNSELAFATLQNNIGLYLIKT